MIGSDMSGALICGRCIHEGVSIINPAEVPECPIPTANDYALAEIDTLATAVMGKLKTMRYRGHGKAASLAVVGRGRHARPAQDNGWKTNRRNKSCYAMLIDQHGRRCLPARTHLNSATSRDVPPAPEAIDRVKERKARFEALLGFVTRHNGWIVSIPADEMSISNASKGATCRSNWRRSDIRFIPMVTPSGYCRMRSSKGSRVAPMAHRNY